MQKQVGFYASLLCLYSIISSSIKYIVFGHPMEWLIKYVAVVVVLSLPLFASYFIESKLLKIVQVVGLVAYAFTTAFYNPQNPMSAIELILAIVLLYQYRLIRKKTILLVLFAIYMIIVVYASQDIEMSIKYLVFYTLVALCYRVSIIKIMEDYAKKRLDTAEHEIELLQKKIIDMKNIVGRVEHINKTNKEILEDMRRYNGQ